MKAETPAESPAAEASEDAIDDPIMLNLPCCVLLVLLVQRQIKVFSGLIWVPLAVLMWKGEGWNCEDVKG